MIIRRQDLPSLIITSLSPRHPPSDLLEDDIGRDEMLGRIGPMSLVLCGILFAWRDLIHQMGNARTESGANRPN